MVCSSVQYDEDGAVRVLFGQTYQAPDGVLEAERTITVSGVWRVEHRNEIIAGSGDLDDPGREERLKVMAGNRLDRAEVSHPGFDLTLYLDDGLVIRCFPCDSVEYAEDPPDGDEIAIPWWIDGVGIPDDWEAPNEAFFEQHG